METDLFDELEKFGKPNQTPQTTRQSAMDRLLREASEFDRESTRKFASGRSKDKDG